MPRLNILELPGGGGFRRDPTPHWSEISQRRFETGQASVNPPAPAAEICPLCKKEFKSKYALGGHSRVHGGMAAVTATAAAEASASVASTVVAAVNREVAPQPSADLSTAYRLREDRVRFFCTICGKDFRSDKAEQGHMRMHPDRDWRGMQPPPPAFNRNSTINGLDTKIVGPVLNLASSVNAAKKFSSSTSTEEYYLGVKKADGVNGQVNIEPVGSGSGSTVPRTSSENQRKRPLISDSTDKARDTRSRSAHHRRPKKPNETEIRINGLHDCEICKKRFETGQALGGHKTKHRRGPPRETREHDEIPVAGQRKLPLDFDLNELPPMEEDAVEPADRA